MWLWLMQSHITLTLRDPPRPGPAQRPGEQSQIVGIVGACYGQEDEQTITQKQKTQGDEGGAEEGVGR